MSKTVEAEINVDGTVTLLEPVEVKVKTRARVTILEPTAVKSSAKENLRAVFKKMHNVEMFRGIENVNRWQRNLRNEWE